MKYLHTMVRVRDIDASLDFYCNKLGLKEIKRKENEKGRFTLIFLGADNSDDHYALLELTYNWDPEEYVGGRNFGHLSSGHKSTDVPRRHGKIPYVKFKTLSAIPLHNNRSA